MNNSNFLKGQDSDQLCSTKFNKRSYLSFSLPLGDGELIKKQINLLAFTHLYIIVTLHVNFTYMLAFISYDIISIIT